MTTQTYPVQLRGFSTLPEVRTFTKGMALRFAGRTILALIHENWLAQTFTPQRMLSYYLTLALNLAHPNGRNDLMAALGVVDQAEVLAREALPNEIPSVILIRGMCHLRHKEPSRALQCFSQLTKWGYSGEQFDQLVREARQSYARTYAVVP